MAGNAKNIRLGPCRVIWGVEDLGFTKGGVEVSITSTQVSITSDQFGETPMDKYVTSRTVNVKVPLIETIPGKLDLILNGGDGTAELATVQTVAGLSMRNASQSLVLHPISKADDDYSEDFVVIRAGVIPNIEATYDSDNERVWSVTFTSFPYYGEFGDIMEADRSGVVVYGGRSAVVANGGLYRASKRSTIGTYFDKNGIMQIANAYVTRPNYVYQNGVWKQKGWLLEPQATNILSGVTYPTANGKFGHVNDTLTGTSWSYSPSVSASQILTFSCYILNSSNLTNFWWGSVTGRPIVNIQNGAFTNDAWQHYNATLTPIDSQWVKFVAHFNNPSVDGESAPYMNNGIYACAQVEFGTTATSYIPPGTTRAAD